MPILHLVDSLGLGGVQTLIKGIFESQKDNQDIFLYSLRTKKIQTNVRHLNVMIDSSTSKFSFSVIKKIKKIIADHNIEILHCHLFRAQVCGWLIKKLFFPDIKLIFHEHGQVNQTISEGPLEYLLYYLLIQVAKNKVDLFLVATGDTQNALVRRFGIDIGRIKIIKNISIIKSRNLPDDEYFINQKKNDLGISENCFVFGFAGRLKKAKGWREFIDAADIILATNTNCKFLIVGDGPDRESLISYIPKEHKDNIIYLGYLDNILWFYKIINCLALPSYHESYSCVQAEAMAIGVPVVGFDSPGIGDSSAMGKIALLSPPGDINSLAGNMSKVYHDNNLRNELITNGLKVTEVDPIGDYWDNLMIAYSELIGK